MHGYLINDRRIDHHKVIFVLILSYIHQRTLTIIVKDTLQELFILFIICYLTKGWRLLKFNFKNHMEKF